MYHYLSFFGHPRLIKVVNLQKRNKYPKPAKNRKTENLQQAPVVVVSDAGKLHQKDAGLLVNSLLKASAFEYLPANKEMRWVALALV